MNSYLRILKRILTKGTPKMPYRQSEQRTLSQGTIGLPNVIFSHDMCDGFPLLTTKSMSLRNVAVELEFFIKGLTDKRWLQERKCYIWNGWANPIKVAETEERTGGLLCHGIEPPTIEEIKKQERDLGPIYGYQWRTFNKTYPGQCEVDGDFDSHTDQLKYITDTLRSNPTDRRMVCSAWNPNQLYLMGLPACHFCFNVIVYDGKVNLWWGQRSCDYLLGVPYNIASYGLLLTLLSRHAGLEPGNLMGVLGDCHLYDNQIKAARQQLRRTPRGLPQLHIPNNDGDRFDLWKWDHTQFVLEGYDPHPALDKVEVVV